MSDSSQPLEGPTPHLVIALIASAVGSGFQHGYHTGVVNAPEALLKEFINETFFFRYQEYPSNNMVTIIFSVMVSIFCLGGMVGAFLTSLLSERFGSKGALLLNNVLVFGSCVLMGIAQIADNFIMLIVGRFTIGINCGLNAGIAPMYLTEISPVHLRGAAGTMYQMVIVISILVSQIFGLPAILGTQERWPILFAIPIVPSVFMLTILTFCPESPRYILIIKKDDVAAEEALTWFRQRDVALEMEEMQAECRKLESMPKTTLKEMWFNKTLRKPLIVASVVMISQQFSGINAIIFYSTGIFITAGLKSEHAVYATMGIGIVNLLATILSLVLVEKAGRKGLLIFGLAGDMVITSLLTICLGFILKHVYGYFYNGELFREESNNEAPWLSGICVALVVIFIMLFAVGPGPIPWFLASEFFSQGPRPIATGFTVAVNWISNFIVGLCFLPIKDLINEFVFLIFTFFLALFTLFTCLEVPETKGRKIEDITAEWN